METGALGALLIAIAIVWAGDVPQLLPAVTVIFPAEVSAVKIIESLVEVPDHVEGNVQVYVAAPLTEST
jgi:hypothetical protein